MILAKYITYFEQEPLSIKKMKLMRVNIQSPLMMGSLSHLEKYADGEF